jgi:hypothetical protein
MGRTMITRIGLTAMVAGCSGGGPRSAPVQFTVSFPAAAHADPITGRVFVVITRDTSPEPRLQAGSFTQTTPLFGTDVSGLAAGQSATITDTMPGYPTATLRDLPAGDYYVQALMNVYTEFHRADGHTIWAHMDQWEGQQFNRSPGNLVSEVLRVHLDPHAGYAVALSLTKILPPVVVPPDSKYVKRIKIQSDMLTKWWGHPIYFGATVLLPEGYDTHPNVNYPVLYEQDHFGLHAPLGFDTVARPIPPAVAALYASYNLTPGYALYQAWTKPKFPRMIVVTLQHPTPYFDDSYAVNSANNGPYGDAIMQELIPYVESHFRIIKKPYARVLTGGSTGGWESLALQLYHPEFFGGTWTQFPDPIDFHHYDMVDAYSDSNAFTPNRPKEPGFLDVVSSWYRPERWIMRANDGQPLVSVRLFSQLEDVLGSHGRSAEQLEIWEAAYGPVGGDGYPVPLWDKRTGVINHDVATYMRDHGYDLSAYVKSHWSTLGPQIVDKIHIDVGDMDNFYLNLAVYDFQATMDSTKNPHVPGVFLYGRPEKGHGWRHAFTPDLLREMTAAITKHAPSGESTSAWKY